MPEDVLKQITETLTEVHESKMAFQSKHYDELIKEQKEVTKMMDNLYMDKLKRRITDNVYDRFYQKFKDQSIDITICLEQLQETDDNYFVTVKYMLELATRAYDLFMSSEVEEKKQLIKLVLSNLRLKDENIVYDAHKLLI